MEHLTLTSNTLAYGDVTTNSNPSERFVDWSTKLTVEVENPKSEAFTVVPNSTLQVFNGIRSTSIDNTTEFELKLSILASDRYRFTYTNTGTDPVFRTNRNLLVSGTSLALSVNSNQTATVTATIGTFSGVQVGDAVFIPGLTTGDLAGAFSPDNEGFWVVLSVSGDGSSLQISRPLDQGFSALGETVTPSDDYQFQAFSSGGVQVGDTVDISDGFSSSVQKSYKVQTVTPTWFEVISVASLPITETAVPTTIGIIFYSNAKRFLRIETDQEAVVQLNGDTGKTNRLSPWAPGDKALRAVYEKVGIAWSVSLVNLSSVPMKAIVISAE